MNRMDRYYKSEEKTVKRTNKNQDLYDKIYEAGEYSNIEGIATIDKSNEVDITKVKNMLKNREEYQRQKEINNFKLTKEEVPSYETFEIDDEKVYDIRDILEKAKINKPEEEYKSLDNINFEIIKELKEKNTKKDEEELKEMIDTISQTSQLNKLSNQELGLDIFDDLKSNNNTIIEDKDSIREILEAAKKNDEKNEITNVGIDKSFFTSSLNFGKKDFEEIQELNKKTNNNHTLLKILFFIITLCITSVIIYLVYSLIN